MNIDSYQKKLDSLPVRHFTVTELENRLQEIQKGKARRKAGIILTAFCLMLAVCLMYAGFLPSGDAFTVTVYAADGKGVALSGEPARFAFSPTPHYTVYFPDSDSGTVNLNLFFHVEGDNIEEITVSCSDHEMEADNPHEAQAYFVENITMDTADYKQAMDEIKGEENFLSSLEGPDTTFVTKLVGNSYTVKYQEQDRVQYGLVVRATKGDGDTFSIAETVLNAEIRYTNGKSVQKEIKIAASENIYDGFEIIMK